MTNTQTQINFEEIKEKASQLQTNAKREHFLQDQLKSIIKQSKKAKQNYEHCLKKANKIYLELESLRTAQSEKE